eukprot:TRINITY_DN10395_c0_g1_i2.p1 TRINITY_DN10395_c0_g1~~TRINITY_DN10395_c0_g1_i2.p1  ORF type:complete len:230 (-),score=0.18 TRINITY_DN10395_c0_g1_i2:5-694(-)
MYLTSQNKTPENVRLHYTRNAACYTDINHFQVKNSLVNRETSPEPNTKKSMYHTTLKQRPNDNQHSPIHIPITPSKPSYTQSIFGNHNKVPELNFGHQRKLDFGSNLENRNQNNHFMHKPQKQELNEMEVETKPFDLQEEEELPVLTLGASESVMEEMPDFVMPLKRSNSIINRWLVSDTIFKGKYSTGATPKLERVQVPLTNRQSIFIPIPIVYLNLTFPMYLSLIHI